MRNSFLLATVAALAIANVVMYFARLDGPVREGVAPVASSAENGSPEGPRVPGAVDSAGETTSEASGEARAAGAPARPTVASFDDDAGIDTKHEDLAFDLELQEDIEALHARIAEELDELMRVAAARPAPKRLRLPAEEARAVMEHEIAEELERAEAEAEARNGDAEILGDPQGTAGETF